MATIKEPNVQSVRSASGNAYTGDPRTAGNVVIKTSDGISTASNTAKTYPGTPGPNANAANTSQRSVTMPTYPGTPAPAANGANGMNGNVNDFLKMYDDDRVNQINSMYDAQKAANLAELESAYNQNMSNAQAAKDQIDPTYQQSANDVSAAYERTRRNNNQMAAANGLNTGAAGQQAVAQSNAYLNSLGQVRTAQANAINEANRGMADMEAQYKQQVAAALANNDYQRAVALMNESNAAYQRNYQQQQDEYAKQIAQRNWDYQQQQDEYNRNLQEQQIAYQREQDAYQKEINQRNWDYQTQQADYQKQMDNAKLRAGWGDFSGYESLYGKDTANLMSTIWNTQNPDLAYQLGRISGDQYYNLTGQYPIGYTPAGSAYGGNGGVLGTHDYELYLGGKPVTVQDYMEYMAAQEGNQPNGNGESPMQAYVNMAVAEGVDATTINDNLVRMTVGGKGSAEEARSLLRRYGE